MSVDRLCKSFGGVRALDQVTLSFPSSGIVALIGPNGSGKTTLFNILSGFVAPDSGECLLRGRRITRLAPYRIARMGIARTFQQVRIVRQLSVVENLCLARPGQAGERLSIALAGLRYGAEEGDNRKVAEELLERMGLQQLGHRRAGDLSYGQQKLLSLGCCLAMDPAILLLDEPFAGVHPAIATRIGELLSGMAKSGNLVVIIEHNLRQLAEMADEAIVLHRGAVLARGPLADVLGDDEVVEAYAG